MSEARVPATPEELRRELESIFPEFAAVDQGGVLENAVATCMLEHLHQVRCDRALRPFLSPAARERMRA